MSGALDQVPSFAVRPRALPGRFANRLCNPTPPFGDTLRFDSLSSREAMSELFDLELTRSLEEHGLAPASVRG